jgi:hypothetical protein
MDLSLYGSGDSFNGRVISIRYAPCTPEQKTNENRNDRSKCLMDDVTDPGALRQKYKDSINYLKDPIMKVWFNH